MFSSLLGVLAPAFLVAYPFDCGVALFDLSPVTLFLGVENWRVLFSYLAGVLLVLASRGWVSSPFLSVSCAGLSSMPPRRRVDIGVDSLDRSEFEGPLGVSLHTGLATSLTDSAIGGAS